MKSSELRALLESLEKEHGDCEVMTEGCDCDGETGHVVLLELSKNYFYITRGTPQDLEEHRQHMELLEAQWRAADAKLEEQYPGLTPL